MLPGPVFNVELVTTARRRRYYAIRVGYGLLLLYVIWQNYRALTGFIDGVPDREYNSRQLAAFASETFSAFVAIQAVAVLALTPALVAGVIADEHRRKTLHYLLASRLTGAEIVLGKLMARLLHVLVFLAIGLPVIAGLTLFGGIDPFDVLRVDAGTATAAFFLASLSILVSTVTKRARDAILVTYLMEGAWLFGPPVFRWWISSDFPVTAAGLLPTLEWLNATNPSLIFDMAGRKGGLNLDWAWMCGLQMAVGIAAIAVAVMRLRAGFRGEGASRRFFRPSRNPRVRRRLLPRPPCGDEPMLWKECQVSRSGGVARVVSGLFVAALLLGIGYGSVRYGLGAFAEVLTYGYGLTGTRPDRVTYNEFLRYLGMTGLYLLAAIGTAATAAGGVTGEKEGDTWTSLTATDLSGADILRAKMIGAVWGMRWLLAMLAVQGLLGVATGALHPFGLAAQAIETAAFLGFAAALGTFFSLHLRTTTRALAATVATMLLVNGGYLFCCIPMGGANSPLIALGCTPMIFAISGLSYSDVDMLMGSGSHPGFLLPQRGDMIGLVVLGTAFYAASALGLALMAIGGFDRAIDRPNRLDQRSPKAVADRENPG